jgi:ParB family chromosome partitioning protein
MPGRNGRSLLRADALLAGSPVGEGERRALAAAVADQGRVTRVASIGVGEICPTPEDQNSRSARSYDAASIQEMADSIRAVGIIQPIVVRPIQPHEAERYALSINGQTTYPQYVIIAGNRRYHGAVAGGRTQEPCVIRVTDADSAFMLNVVENIARRALSGAERARSLARLASMQDAEGRPLGVREIARRTGFGLGTISQWLAIHRSPALMEALANEQIDVGRAMQLAPLASLEPERLEDVLAEAATLPQPDVQRLVRALSPPRGGGATCCLGQRTTSDGGISSADAGGHRRQRGA